PLAFTKTFAMVAASILSITLVPVLMTIFIRGKHLKPEARNPVSRLFAWIYEPIIGLALRWKWAALLVNVAVVPLTIPLLFMIGITTPVGIKILGSDLNEIQRIGGDIERALQRIRGTRSVYAERVAQGYFTDIRVDREAIARHGLMIADVHDVIASAIGGQNITRTIEGRER